MPLLSLFLNFFLIQTISYCLKYSINTSSPYFQPINIYIIENDIVVNMNLNNMTSIPQFFENIQTKDNNITLELISDLVINQVLLIKVNFSIISMNENDKRKLIFQNSGKISIDSNISFSLISLEINQDLKNSNGSTILFEFEEMIGIFILVDIIILLLPYLKYCFLELFVSEFYQ